MSPFALPPEYVDADVVDLETIGRVSGEARVIEIWFAAVGDRLYLLSGGRDGAHWVRNLRANPAVRLHFPGRTFDGVAREIEGESDEDVARRALAAKYQGWREGRRLSAWARTSLPVRIDLDGEPTS